MTSLTKNPHPPTKIFFRVQTRRLAESLLTFWTALYSGWRPSYARAKPRAIRMFWRENPRKRPEAKVLIEMRKSTHTWSYIFAQVFSYFVSTGSIKTWFSMNNSKATAVTYTSSESVAIIYLHKETSFVFDTSSVLCESWQWNKVRKTTYCAKNKSEIIKPKNDSLTH